MDAFNAIERLNYIHKVGKIISENMQHHFHSMIVPINPYRGTEKRVSQWEEIMRKFSEEHKEECKYVIPHNR